MAFLDIFRGKNTAPASVERAEPVIRVPAGTPPEAKVSAAGPVYASYHVGKPIWTERDYASLAREAYFMNAISYRCVNMLASAAATIPLILQRKGKEVEDHPILDLLKRPSPTQSGKALKQRHLSFHLLAGNGYLEAVGPKNLQSPPKELWSLRPDRMKVIGGASGLPSAFRYSHMGSDKTWTVNQLNGRSEILHTKEFNPLSDWYGMSRVEAAAYGIDRHNAASGHNKALLDNGARPSGAMVFEPIKDVDGTFHAAPEPTIRKAEKELVERHGGSDNAGKPMVLGGAIKWLEMGINPRDMDFGEGKDDAARDICIAWGVPHVLLVKGSSTYNNLSEAKLEFYEDNVIPLLDDFLGELNVWLTPRFGDGLELKADLDSVSALEERRVSRRKSVTDLLDKQVIDEEEAREMLGYGPRGDDAVKKVEATVITALLALVETAGIEPLARYLRAVRLVTPNTTDKQILSAALALIEEEEEEEDEELNPEDEDSDDDETDD